jgi:ABC-2 type transport system ATP-binding protein
VRVRAPRLEALYLDALRPRGIADHDAARASTPLRAGAAG